MTKTEVEINSGEYPFFELSLSLSVKNQISKGRWRPWKQETNGVDKKVLPMDTGKKERQQI
jgi:hypothetical protein